MASNEDFPKAVDITKQLGAHAKRMMKPKDIPIYGVTMESNKDIKKEPEVLLNAVRETRLETQKAYTEAQNVIIPIVESAVNIIETGKAHANSTYQMIQDEKDPVVNGLVIGGSAILGFTVASFAKRFRLLKRVLFTSITAGGSAYICYPKESLLQIKSLSEEADRLGLIAYNFIQGVQPSDASKKLVADVDTNSRVTMRRNNSYTFYFSVIPSNTVI